MPLRQSMGEEEMNECEMGLSEHKWVKPPNLYFEMLYFIKPKYLNLSTINEDLDKWMNLLDLMVCEICRKQDRKIK